MFRGLVIDELKTLNTRKTKLYLTYKEAHNAAENLCKRTMGDRGRIDVEEDESTHGGPREGAGRPATGAKPNRTFRLTDDEYKKVKEFINQLRK